ncbi:MAG: nuclear transport factor 2 family protein [Pseudomonadota bacterium]
MANECIETWHQVVETRSHDLLGQVLADDVVFFSPVVHTPQKGKAITTKYLLAALDVLVNSSWRYTAETYNATQAVLEFEAEVDGIIINGVDIITWNDQQQISSFKVMVRPLKAIGLLHQKMAEKLAA